MTDPFVSTETDRTKSRWVAGVFREFGRPRTTIRALYYYALKREVADYPICGGFVGEIRITRRYHESDARKLSKWAGKAMALGFIPGDAILEEVPGEHVFIPCEGTKLIEESRAYAGAHGEHVFTPGEGTKGLRLELWVPRSDLISLLVEGCMERGITLVSAGPHPSDDAIKKLIRRSDAAPTVVLCLSDMSPSGITLCGDLAKRIGGAAGNLDIKVKRIGLTPRQVLDLGLPMIAAGKASRDLQRLYRDYLKPSGIKDRWMVEIDALEAIYPGGLAGFVVDQEIGSLGGPWLLDIRNGIVAGEGDIDSAPPR